MLFVLIELMTFKPLVDCVYSKKIIEIEKLFPLFTVCTSVLVHALSQTLGAERKMKERRASRGLVKEGATFLWSPFTMKGNLFLTAKARTAKNI